MAWSRVLPLLLLAACAAQTDDDGAASGESDLTAFDKAMPDVDAISYDVDLSITNAAKSHETFAITAKATFVATRHLATLDLDFDGHTIDSVQVDGQSAQYTRHGTTLTITLPRAVDAGASVKTNIAYHGDVFQADGNPRTDFEHFGGFYVQHAAGGTIFTSLGWPSSTRKWIPVRDHPRDGAIITMRATFPGDLTVIANGKQKSSTPNADGTKTWSFSSEKPIPIYDLHLSASNRWLERTQHAPQSNVTVRALTYKEHTRIADQVYAGDAQAAAVDYYSKTFGTYGWTDELRYLEEPIFSGGMENASAISLDDSLFTRIDVAETRRTTFHELAHHWSGNLVRYRSWNDFWLSEGFTEYLTRRFVEDHDGLAAGKALWRTTVQAGLDAEASDLHPVRPADPEKSVLTFFDDVVYEKGAVVLRMIEEQVGRDAFTAFMKSWFAKHAYTAMGTDDFVKELSAATNQDWKPFFQQWVYGVSHPTLKASATRTDASHVQVTLEQTQSGNAFTLPVEVALGSKVVTIAMTGKTATADVELATDPTSITVDPNEQLFIERSCTTNACPTGMHCSSRKVCQ